MATPDPGTIRWCLRRSDVDGMDLPELDLPEGAVPAGMPVPVIDNGSIRGWMVYWWECF
jgi:hypothetical protein